MPAKWKKDLQIGLIRDSEKNRDKAHTHMLRYVHLVHQQDGQTDSIDRMNRSSMTDAMEQMAFDVR